MFKRSSSCDHFFYTVILNIYIKLFIIILSGQYSSSIFLTAQTGEKFMFLFKYFDEDYIIGTLLNMLQAKRSISQMYKFDN